jgi:hypothetical protein
MNFCKVDGCRYASTHVTSSHCCGKCKMYGHGQRECQNIDLIISLQKYYNDIMPNDLYCNVLNCMYPHTHSSENHSCLYCNKKDTHTKKCPAIDISPNVISFDFHEYIPNEIKTIPIKIGYYIIKYGGLGCCWYIRNNNNKIEYFFMHSDSWGQYGENTSDLEKLNYFIHGYKLELASH